MTTDIPSTLGSVSAEWLDQQLAAAGHDLPPIATLTLEPMDGFVGALGEVGIVRVTWSDDAPHLPSSFVAKCPLDEEMAKIFNQVMQYYVREAGFYRDLVDRVDMTIPKAWVNLYDHDTGAGFLMLDHVTDATKGDILSGCSVEEMRGLVAQLAHMHGMFWMDESLRELTWLMDWSAESFELGIPIIGEAWETLTTQEPDRIPADVAEMVGQTWISDTVNWLARFGERPWTLTHIDYELDNVLFTAEGPVIIDWQSPMRGFPGAWTSAGCSPPRHNDETLEPRSPSCSTLYRRELAMRAAWPRLDGGTSSRRTWRSGMLQFTRRCARSRTCRTLPHTSADTGGSDARPVREVPPGLHRCFEHPLEPGRPRRPPPVDPTHRGVEPVELVIVRHARPRNARNAKTTKARRIHRCPTTAGRAGPPGRGVPGTPRASITWWPARWSRAHQTAHSRSPSCWVVEIELRDDLREVDQHRKRLHPPWRR